MTTTTAIMSPEILALLQQAMSTSHSSVLKVGFNLGLLEYALNNRTGKNGKPKIVTAIRGDYFESNAPIIQGQGVQMETEEGANWLKTLAEYANQAGACLDISVTFDYKTLANIFKQMQAGKMTYAVITLSKVSGIHQRIAKNKAGDDITALSVDLFDREEIQVEAAANPMAANATYCADDSVWFKAIENSAKAKRSGMDKWKAVQDAKEGDQKTASNDADDLDALEDEEVVATTTA